MTSPSVLKKLHNSNRIISFLLFFDLFWEISRQSFVLVAWGFAQIYYYFVAGEPHLFWQQALYLANYFVALEPLLYWQQALYHSISLHYSQVVHFIQEVKDLFVDPVGCCDHRFEIYSLCLRYGLK